jgi:hypothetical protein
MQKTVFLTLGYLNFKNLFTCKIAINFDILQVY